MEKYPDTSGSLSKDEQCKTESTTDMKSDLHHITRIPPPSPLCSDTQLLRPDLPKELPAGKLHILPTLSCSPHLLHHPPGPTNLTHAQSPRRPSTRLMISARSIGSSASTPSREHWEEQTRFRTPPLAELN